ncbi:Phospholipid/glycerol acyltransferase [Dillenia turbinata]|uniref:Phospholipid/glycerol acyltransferase n=1 Tax=Dillenia turbinata TaxID=194707 RepID=A0AAN8UF88_9MAGN
MQTKPTPASTRPTHSPQAKPHPPRPTAKAKKKAAQPKNKKEPQRGQEPKTRTHPQERNASQENRKGQQEAEKKREKTETREESENKARRKREHEGARKGKPSQERHRQTGESPKQEPNQLALDIFYLYTVPSTKGTRLIPSSFPQTAAKLFPTTAILMTMPKLLLRRLENLLCHSLKADIHQYGLSRLEELASHTVIFQMEEVLLVSWSLFPYFMLVAYEAGGPLRGFLLFLLYPLVCLLGQELGLRIMVFVCFVGIKESTFNIGRSVLPKFLLEDTAYEGFEMVTQCRRKVGVSDMPRVMVESFLRDYLGIEAIVGRELKVVFGYYVGFMEEKAGTILLEDTFREEKWDSHAIGIGCFNKSHIHPLFSHCKEFYFIKEAQKKNWQSLPRKSYPKPLIFHDGRLAFRPSPLAYLVMLLWLPLGLLIFLIRFLTGLLLPYDISTPILAFTGLRAKIKGVSSEPRKNKKEPSKGILYICNHKTLLDPLFISGILRKRLTAVTYSLSKFSEMVAPIRTVRLTRNRDKDSETMQKLLSETDLIVCPEGTTCREPYLLRFSPLFAEISDDIVPIAIDVKVTFFYGTTAGGFKFLDPVYLLLNPYPTYHVHFLEKLPAAYTCGAGRKSKFEVANHVQAELARALEFEVTHFTRKDKYMILADNEGMI